MYPTRTKINNLVLILIFDKERGLQNNKKWISTFFQFGWTLLSAKWFCDHLICESSQIQTPLKNVYNRSQEPAASTLLALMQRRRENFGGLRRRYLNLLNSFSLVLLRWFFNPRWPIKLWGPRQPSISPWPYNASARSKKYIAWNHST